ncbi:TonB family protein [Bradyrhizobium prioriisuperbiae]|uniref:energy transducer TonB family protein n=1 Tax=Bradyrhizobium prioriisuperbiae TaxID=2854389 RepID=UPI0028F043FF|nr:TonB family protein [Bradyrhizobium prioritasuperba]
MTDPDATSRPSRSLWAFAAIVALALHVGGVAFAVASMQADDADDPDSVQGIEIGLEPTAPRGEQSELPPGPDSEASAASPAQVEQKAELKQTELPKDTPTETDDPDRVVAPDATNKPQEEIPDKPTVQQTASTESIASEATAMPTSDNLPVSDKAIRVRTSWQKDLSAHLDRHKRYPTDRPQKAAKIVLSFSIDRTGHLLSSSIVESSGDPAFDAAALSMLKRSDPLPPPPPLIADEGLSFTVPVIFRIKGKG